MADEKSRNALSINRAFGAIYLMKSRNFVLEGFEKVLDAHDRVISLVSYPYADLQGQARWRISRTDQVGSKIHLICQAKKHGSLRMESVGSSEDHQNTSFMRFKKMLFTNHQVKFPEIAI